MITNGVIKYGETRKIADFENKRADVELSFTAPESTTQIAAFITAIQDEAKFRCHQMLGISAKPEHLVSQALAFPNLLSDTEVADKRAKVHNRRAPKMPVAESVTVTPADPAAMAEPEQYGKPVPEQIKEAAIAAGDPSFVITDTDLLDATTKRQQDVKNPIAIRKLLGDLGVKTPPGRLVDLTQDKRQAYLDGLKDIKPLA